MTPSHAFAGNTFRRLAERRNDVEWLQQLDTDRIQVLPIWHGRVLAQVNEHTRRMVSVDRQTTAAGTASLILLGEFREQIFFAVDIESDTEPVIHATAQFHDLRAVSGLLGRDELALLGYARALIHWRSTHRYCGKCGSLNHSTHAGHVMECTNANCKQQNFPRLDPAVIVLITDGHRVLLGRQARFPAGRYSTIAGFVEWAESIEEAVAREVHEETGVVVDEVQYHSSQPWPFPSSLMLGFVAHAASTDITLNDGELEDARWFSRDDIAAGALSLPPVQSISFALIEQWYNQQAPRPLRDEPLVKIDSPMQAFKAR